MPVNTLLYATEPRRPIQQLHAISAPFNRWLHWQNGDKNDKFTSEILETIAEQYWGGKPAADFSTFQGKALAAKMIQDYNYVRESLILCDPAWPIYQVLFFDDTVKPYTLESQIVSAITGRHINEEVLRLMGERNFNLQRAILMRQGWGGRKGDVILDFLHREPLQEIFYDPTCIAPGKDGTIVSRKNAVVDREEFEKTKGEYYQLRGWDVESGFQTKTKLIELQLADIADDLERQQLLR